MTTERRRFLVQSGLLLMAAAACELWAWTHAAHRGALELCGVALLLWNAWMGALRGPAQRSTVVSLALDSATNKETTTS